MFTNQMGFNLRISGQKTTSEEVPRAGANIRRTCLASIYPSNPRAAEAGRLPMSRRLNQKRISASCFDLHQMISIPIAGMLTCFLALLLSTSTAAELLHTCPESIGDIPATVIGSIQRGINIERWAVARNPREPTTEELQLIKSLGITHIRLPVDPLNLFYESLRPGFDPNERFLTHLDSIIHKLLGLGFVISVDMHPRTAFMSRYKREPDSTLPELAQAWRLLANRYKDLPRDAVLYEVLNETPVSQKTWERHSTELVRTIRAIDGERILVIGPPNYQRIDTLMHLKPLPDSRTVYAVHYYDPMTFTHQGMPWSPRNPISRLSGIPFPTHLEDPAIQNALSRLEANNDASAVGKLRSDLKVAWNEARILRDFGKIAQWVTQNKRPVIVNEFGVIASTTPPNDRARWLEAVRKGAEAACVGWVHWDYGGAFAFTVQENGLRRPDPIVVKALGLKSND